MKTWQEFIELKEAMGTTPPARRSATLNLDPAQKAAGIAAHRAAQQPQQAPAYGAPVSDEEMGAQYAKSMQVQQAMAAAEKARQARRGV